MPRKIRELIRDLKEAGWYPVRGSKHAKFKHAKAKGSVILNRDEGDDARHYEEKEVRKAIKAAQQEEEKHGREG
jgi:predicted RNA binding protein YcfA (HicA-like mRNA interferase family)